MPYPVRVNRADHTPGAAVEALGLRKTYRGVRRRTTAVDALDLLVPARGLHVLLGPSGSGKSTVLRLLLGLAHPDAGAARILGVTVPDVGRELAGRVGAVVGDPGFVDRLTGRRNLLMHPAATSREQVDLALRNAGLAAVALDTVGTYPPGARRRLELAAALLSAPDLLVADDPTGDLDPGDAREVRTLLRKIAGRGPAVLLATGTLVEAQQLADTVTVIRDGRAVADGAAADVIGEVATSVRLRVDDPERAVAELTAAKFTARREGDHVVVDGVAEPADVSKALARKKLYLTEMRTQRESLASLVQRLAPEPAPEPAAPSRAERRAARKEAQRKEAQRKEADRKEAERTRAEKTKAAEREAAEKTKAEAKAARSRPTGSKAPEAETAGSTSPAPEQAPRSPDRAVRTQERAARKQEKRDERELAKLLRQEEREAAAQATRDAKQARKDAKQARKDERELAALIAAEEKQQAAPPEPAEPAPRTTDTPAPRSSSDTTDPESRQMSARERRRAAFEASVAEKQAAYDAQVAARDQAAADKEADRRARQESRRAKHEERERRKRARAASTPDRNDTSEEHA